MSKFMTDSNENTYHFHLPFEKTASMETLCKQLI